MENRNMVEQIETVVEEIEKEEIVLDLLSPRVIKLESEYELHSKVSIEPFERGFGYTLGNALRRVLLSSLPGFAITEVQIDGVLHEYTTIDGVQEDVVEILLNLKNVAINLQSRDHAEFVLSKKGPGEITAGDIQVDQDVVIVNPDHHIATINSDKELNMQLRVEKGTGYRPVVRNEGEDDVDETIGLLKLDASFGPIKKVSYTVESARVENRTDLDKLIVDLETDGTIEPESAIKYAGAILQNQLSIFVDLTRVQEQQKEEEEQHTRRRRRRQRQRRQIIRTHTTNNNKKKKKKNKKEKTHKKNTKKKKNTNTHTKQEETNTAEEDEEEDK